MHANTIDTPADVVDQLKNIIYVYDARLNVEERSMLSVAYKNITNDLRNSWRIIDQLETLELSRGRARPMALLKLEKSNIEQELVDACKEIVKASFQIWEHIQLSENLPPDLGRKTHPLRNGR